MKGLLQKDLYQMWYYARAILITSVIMMMVVAVLPWENGSYFMVYAGFLVSMLPMTLLAYDQNSRFAGYSAALPVTTGQLVGCKYLIGLGNMVLADVLAALVLFVRQLRGGNLTPEAVIAALVQVAVMPILGSAVLLPMTYRFGYEKAKYVFYLVVGLFAAVMGFGLAEIGSPSGIKLQVGAGSVPAMLGFWLLCLVLYAASWRLSVAWYGKAEE